MTRYFYESYLLHPPALDENDLLISNWKIIKQNDDFSEETIYDGDEAGFEKFAHEHNIVFSDSSEFDD